MTTAFLLIGILACTAQERPRNGSISGVVRDQATGAPIPEAVVSVYTGTQQVKSITDSQGQYRLSDLPPQTYRVMAVIRTPAPRYHEANVKVGAGRDLTSIDLLVRSVGRISGKVLDQNKEPVPNASVLLVSREYRLGEVRYFPKESANTNDQGVYTLQSVDVGTPYLILAARRTPVDTDSAAPLEPKLRKPVYVPTYYPSSAEREGAAPVTLRAGERREGFDLQLLRAPSYCASGTLATEAGPGEGGLIIAGREVDIGVSRTGGAMMMPPNGRVGPNGKFRVCDLRPGVYRLIQYPTGGPFRFGDTWITIHDRDLENLRVLGELGREVPGTAVWDGAPPDPPLPANLTLLLRTNRMGFSETAPRASFTIPAEFTLTDVLLDDYEIATNINAPGVYVKDIYYGNSSVLHQRFRRAAGSDLRVLMARDGGKIQVNVADKDGNPIRDAWVAVIPEAVRSEAALADAAARGEADQDGGYTTRTLAPGKYLVLATSSPLDDTVERIGKLWAARARGKAVELGPNGSVQVTIQPIALD